MIGVNVPGNSKLWVNMLDLVVIYFVTYSILLRVEFKFIPIPKELIELGSYVKTFDVYIIFFDTKKQDILNFI